jgi:hypothetical protein
MKEKVSYVFIRKNIYKKLQVIELKGGRVSASSYSILQLPKEVW